MVGLVTGSGTGDIGHMVLALLDEGEKVVGLDNLPTGFRWVAPEGIPLVIGDVGDTSLVDQIFTDHRIDAIAHFTTKIVVPDSVAVTPTHYLNGAAKGKWEETRGDAGRVSWSLSRERARPVMGTIGVKIWSEFIGVDGIPAQHEIFVIRRDVVRSQIKHFGLILEEGKSRLQQVQGEQTPRQVEQSGIRGRVCQGCGQRRAIHDYRIRSIQTLFGICQVRVSRLRACDCSGQLAAKASNRLPLLLAGHDRKNVRNGLARVAIRSRQEILRARLGSRLGPDPISVFIDGAHLRAAPGHQTRHFEIVMGRVETVDRKPRHFAAASWKGLPIWSSGAESTVNVPVNACMNKLQELRSPSIGSQRVLQAGAAVIDGRLPAGSLISRHDRQSFPSPDILCQDSHP